MTSLKCILHFITGNPILHSSMALEKLGGWQAFRLKNGSRLGHHHRSRKEAKEEITTGLSLCQFEKSQFLGLQIFLL